MLRHTILAASLSLIAGASAPSTAAVAAADPAAFINSLGNQALAVIGSDAALDQKVDYFRRMLRQDFDLRGIARFVLGGYWRGASAVQRREFRRLFEDYLLRFYGERLAQYGGGGLRVTGSRSDPAGLVVTSEIVGPQGRPIEVDWRLSASDGFYKIGDVTLEGISMALSYRSEFAMEIRRSGGVQGLLEALRRKTASAAYGSSTPALAAGAAAG